MISALLNLGSAALVLPGCILAFAFLAVQYVAKRSLGGLFDAFWAALDWLPPPEHFWLWSIAAITTLCATVGVMFRLPWLLPSLVLSAGVASAAYTHWVAGSTDIATDPILWLSCLGIGLSAWQLKRCRRQAPVGGPPLSAQKSRT